MSIDRIVMAFAGTMILLSLLLAQLFSPWRLLLTAFVGVNLLQAAFTGLCPLAIALKRYCAKSGAAFSTSSTFSIGALIVRSALM